MERKGDQQWVRKCINFKVDGSAGGGGLERPGWPFSPAWNITTLNDPRLIRVIFDSSHL